MQRHDSTCFCIMDSWQHVKDVPLSLCVCLDYLFFDNCKIWLSHETIFPCNTDAKVWFREKVPPNLFQHCQCASVQVTALTLDQDNSLGTLIGTLIFQRDNLLTPQRLADRDQWRRVTWNKHQWFSWSNYVKITWTQHKEMLGMHSCLQSLFWSLWSVLHLRLMFPLFTCYQQRTCLNFVYS